MPTSMMISQQNQIARLATKIPAGFLAAASKTQIPYMESESCWFMARAAQTSASA